MSSPEIYELVNAPITAHAFNEDRKYKNSFCLNHHLKLNAVFFFFFLLLELVICPNTNDAQIYQYGHSNAKLLHTLKGVSIYLLSFFYIEI